MHKAEQQPTTPTSSTSPPPTTADPSRRSRRGLFADLSRAALGKALAAAAPLVALANAHPDAELLDVLGRLTQIEEAIYPAVGTGCRTIQEEDEREVRVAPLHAERMALVDQACGLRAKTPAGWRARALTLLLEDEELQTGDKADACIGDRLLYALIRDMVWEPGA